MKTLTQIKKEKPYYFVSINGQNELESESITECKNYLLKYMKEHKKEIEENGNEWDYYIGMYSICIMD